MQVKTIFVGAFLARKEVLTKFGCAKGCSYQTLVVQELIHGENGDGAISWAGKSHVG